MVVMIKREHLVHEDFVLVAFIVWVYKVGTLTATNDGMIEERKLKGGDLTSDNIY